MLLDPSRDAAIKERLSPPGARFGLQNLLGRACCLKGKRSFIDGRREFQQAFAR